MTFTVAYVTKAGNRFAGNITGRSKDDVIESIIDSLDYDDELKDINIHRTSTHPAFAAFCTSSFPSESYLLSRYNLPAVNKNLGSLVVWFII